MKVRTLNNGKKNLYETLEDVEIAISTGEKVTIPAGFITDFASVPKCLWPVFPPLRGNTADKAFLVHDWAYMYGEIPLSTGKPKQLTRRQADYEMFFLQRKPTITEGSLHGDSTFRAFFMWLAVRLFGGKNWNKYGTRRFHN